MSDQPATYWRRYGTAGAAAALALVAMLLFVAARWMLTPHSIEDAGMTIGAHPAIGQTEYFGMSVYPETGDVPDITMSSAASSPSVQVSGATQLPERAVTVDIVDARINVAENSSDAHLALLYCVHRTKNLGMGTGFADTLHQVCRDVGPLAPGSYLLSDDRDVVLAVTPTQAGTVHVEGLTIDYRDGLRRGSQSVGTKVIADTRK